ncbi:hypothetical protein Rs2_06244 [Raphanus sativus]|nr:hypothetical protein Rs2_37003 [Raphanus sativus]KAJ4904988.1 hypothetical protein Rs2_18939 [Raphanus sativus]KAJ4911623.1 hypothetical protein Rs2_06244 [Raphanus sativus]
MASSSSSSRGKGMAVAPRCLCGLPAKIDQAWTDKNPGRRFYGCVRFKEGNGCNFFRWLDEREVVGWAREALIDARDEIRRQKKLIDELTQELAQCRSTAHDNQLDESRSNPTGESSEIDGISDNGNGIARLLWNMHRLSVLENRKGK